MRVRAGCLPGTASSCFDREAPVRRAVLIGMGIVVALALAVAVLLQPACGGRNRAQTGAGDTTITLAAAQRASQPVVEITIAAVGDVMVHKTILRAADAAGPGSSYDFKPMFAAVAPYLRMPDYTVVNLETVLAGPQFGYTGYPKFNTPGELADALADAGVDLCATANNHAIDRGYSGVVNTLDRLDKAGLAHVGTYRTAEEEKSSQPFIVDIKGVKVAFINYTEELNSVRLPAGCVVKVMDSPWQVAVEADAARKAGADVVIAILHWGRENWTRPEGDQISDALGSADFPGLLPLYVDVILGSHPHVLEPAAGIRRKSASGSRNAYVVYSMGNFCSNMEGSHTDSGAIVYVHIKKMGPSVEVTGLSYMGVYMQHDGSGPGKFSVEPLLSGVAPAPGTSLSTRQQRRLDSAWEFLNYMYYRPEANIVPLDPTELP
jgi:poly-gamma-glutamate capsule biosynthesis protein CapA/YwtB (metallophosphatase superfamily)/preprotein translocase subunit SecG